MSKQSQWVDVWHRRLGSSITHRADIRRVLQYCGGDTNEASRWLDVASVEGYDLSTSDLLCDILLSRIEVLEGGDDE